MLMLFIVGIVLAVVFFKLGVLTVLTVLVGLFEMLGKVLFFGTGLFLLVYAGRWILNRRRTQPVRWVR